MTVVPRAKPIRSIPPAMSSSTISGSLTLSYGLIIGLRGQLYTRIDREMDFGPMTLMPPRVMTNS